MSTNSEVALAILAAFGVLGLLASMGAYLVIGMAWDKSPLRAAVSEQRDSIASGWKLLSRALALRCPRCGLGSIFRSRFRMNEVCAACGAVFWKNQGEWIGPAVVDYTIATMSGLASWAILVMIGASMALQLIVASLAAISLSVAFAPWTRSFWTLLLYISGDMSEANSHKKPDQG